MFVRQSKAVVCHRDRQAEGSSQVGGRNRSKGGCGPYHQLPVDRYLNSIPAPGIEANAYRHADPRALLRLVDLRHAEAATTGWLQIAKASSSNATAYRKGTGASTASS
jgi:hypothetical protein